MISRSEYHSKYALASRQIHFNANALQCAKDKIIALGFKCMMRCTICVGMSVFCVQFVSLFMRTASECRCVRVGGVLKIGNKQRIVTAIKC